MADLDDERNGDAATDADQVHIQEGHKNQHLHLKSLEKGWK